MSSVRDTIIKNFISTKNAILINFQKHSSIFGVRDTTVTGDNSTYLYHLFIHDSGLFEDLDDFLSKYIYERARGNDFFEKSVNYQGILIKDKTKNEYLNKKDPEEFTINLIVRTILNEYINPESKINKLSKLLNSGYENAYDINLLKKIQETKRELEIIISDLVYYFAIMQDTVKKDAETIVEINQEREKIRNGLLVRVSQKDPSLAKDILESRFMNIPTVETYYIKKDFVFYHIQLISNYASLFINDLENKKIDVRSIPIQGDALNALKNIIVNYTFSQFNDFEELYKLATGQFTGYNLLTGKTYYYTVVIQLYQIIHAYVFITPSLFETFMEKKKLVESLNKFPYMREVIELRKNDYERQKEDEMIARIANIFKKRKVPIERKVPSRETVLKGLKLEKIFKKIDELINQNKLNKYLFNPQVYFNSLNSGLEDFYYVTRNIFIFEYARLYDPPRQFFIENGLFSDETEFLTNSINVPLTHSIYDFVRRRNRCHLFEDMYDTINDNPEYKQKIQIVNNMLNEMQNLKLLELTDNLILSYYIANVFELYGYVSINQFLLYVEREIKTRLINNLTEKSQVVQIITTINYIDAIRSAFVNKYNQNLVEPSVKYTSIDNIVVIMTKIREIMILFSTNNVITNNPDEFKSSILSLTKSLKFPNINFTEDQIIQIKSIILNRLDSVKIEPIEVKQSDEIERKQSDEIERKQSDEIERKQSDEIGREGKQLKEGKMSDKKIRTEGKESDKEFKQELEPTTIQELKSPKSKFDYINTTITKIIQLIREINNSVKKIKRDIIPIPSNLQLNKEISTVNYGSVPVYIAYNRIIPDILKFLPEESKILGDFGLKLNKFKNKNILNLSEEDSKSLDALFVRTKNYMDDFVNNLYSFAEDYENIVEYAYKIMNKAFVIDYDIKREMYYYDLHDFKLKDDCTAHIDLANMKYYWGVGNYQLYDPIENQIKKLDISQYRLKGFQEMITEYRNQYNYLLGVYYTPDPNKTKNFEILADLQIGITGSFNWYGKFNPDYAGYYSYEYAVNPVDPLKHYVENPICAAQRELYEETRLFFRLEHIIYKNKNVDNRKNNNTKRLVFSYFVDIRNAEIIDEKTAKQVFSNQNIERFVPIDTITEKFPQVKGDSKYNYYGVRAQPDGVFDNRNLKISVLIAGNDLRDFLKITKSELRGLNDNIRMVSCVGRDIDIKIYANKKEYMAKEDNIIENLIGDDKKDYEESKSQRQKLLEERKRIQQIKPQIKRIEKKIDELREIYQTIIEDTKFEDDVSVQYFLSKEIDIEDEIYDLIQERERLQREITSHVD